LRLTLASALLLHGRSAEAICEADAVLDEKGMPEELLSAAALTRMIGLLTQEDLPGAFGAAMGVVGQVPPAPSANLTGALCTLAFVAWDDGRFAEAVRLLRSAIQTGDRCPPGSLQMYPRLVIAPLLVAMGEDAEADRLLDEGSHELDANGSGIWAALPAAVRTRQHFAAGRLDEALASAGVAHAAHRLGSAEHFQALAELTEADVALFRGDLELATRHVERARVLPAPWGGFGHSMLTWTEARLVDAQGDPQSALRLLASTYDKPSAHQSLFVEEPPSGAWLVRLAVRTGDSGRAEHITRCLDRLAKNNASVGNLAAAALHANALLDTSPKDLARSARQYRHAWAEASAWEDAGAAALRAGEGEHAQAHWSKAADVYRAAGAERDSARVRARLRAVGVRVCNWRRANRPSDGWNSLTEKEGAVVDLVAEGLTNRQVGSRMYLSHHTVAFHLRQVFRKLDINSRGELIRLTMLRQPISPGATDTT
jgi:ATP/maltotriose-dependent transcriptional regulator MalT